jgi:hypothetical protein
MRKVVFSTLVLFLIVLLPNSVFAAIAIDASSPIRVTHTGDCTFQPAQPTVTTAAFNPPANSVLLVLVNADASSDNSITFQDPNIVITNNGAALTWTMIAQRDAFDDATGNGGHASAFYTTLSSARSGMTITVTNSVPDTGPPDPFADCSLSAKAYVVTGADTSSPIGNKAEGSSASNNLTTTAYTTSVANTRGFAVGTDFNSHGGPTTDGTATADSFDVVGTTEGISMYKNSDTATLGSSVTFNMVTSAPALWNWVSFEVLTGSSAMPRRIKFGTNRILKIVKGRLKLTAGN